MNTEVKLLMTFMTQFGRKVSLFVTDPREDITESEIKAVMDLIIEKNKMDIKTRNSIWIETKRERIEPLSFLEVKLFFLNFIDIGRFSLFQFMFLHRSVTSIWKKSEDM